MCCCFSCCGGSGEHHFDRNDNNRSCTDVYALLLLLIFCVGLGCVTYYGYERGDAYRILHGADSFGNTCGRANAPLLTVGDGEEKVPLSGRNMTDKRYLFPLDVARPLSSLWVCIASCPRTAITNVDQLSNTSTSLCVDEKSSAAAALHASDGRCPTLPVYPSSPVLSRCVPDDFMHFGVDLASQIVKFIKEIDWLRSCVQDVIRTAPLIGKMLLLAIVLSATMMLVLRFVAPIAVYFIYGLVVLLFIAASGGIWFLWWTQFGAARFYWATEAGVEAVTTVATPTTTVAVKDGAPEPMIYLHGLKFDEKKFLTEPNISEWTLLGIAIATTITTLAVSTCMWCMLPRGALLVKLFHLAGRGMAAMPCLLLQPLFTLLALLLISAYSLASALLVYTAAEPVSRVSEAPEGLVLVEYNVTTTQRYMLFYQFVGFVWLMEFAFAYQRMVIAGAIATWYFEQTKAHPLCGSRWRTLRYHLGSLAFGSLIITLVRVPRYILMYIYAKMKASENVVVQRLFACCICALKCVEDCLRYLNSNAYTVIAYSGQSFCPAAKTAVNILLDNAANVANLNSVGDLVLFLAKAVVSAVVTAIAFYFIKDDGELAQFWPPLLIIALLSYQVANSFLSVYEMLMDALLLCVTEDASMLKEGSLEYHNENIQKLVETSLLEAKGGGKKRKGARGRVDSAETIALDVHRY